MFAKIEIGFRVTIPMLLVTTACSSSGSGATTPIVSSSDDYVDPITGDGDPQNAFVGTALVSDQRAGGGAHVDENLVNPWGIAYGPDTGFWVANNGSATATLYDEDGHLEDLVVQLPETNDEPATPTGLVYHAGDGFEIGSDNRRAPARFIFATEQGTILGWNEDTSRTRALVAVDRSGDDAVYKGLAISKDGDALRLYATNFSSGEVDVFDGDFELMASAPGSFVDPDLPDDYAPFGIRAIDDKVYVTFAERDREADDVPGKGKGYVSVFELDGTFIERVAEKGTLNAPWAITLAPEDFGKFDGALLIGNFGDGRISAFDAETYEYLGQLEDTSGKTIAIDGLWELVVGNGKDAGETDTLYYTAGPEDEEHGVFGSLSLR